MGTNMKTNNAPQKGKRRQKLHEEQDNKGNPKNPPQYTNWDGQRLK